MEKLLFEKDNRDRIQAVENSFGPAGRALSKPGRILMGEGQLMKQGRRKPQTRTFFLFDDVLVYGSKVLKGHWHKNQKILPLESIQLEDMEDSVGFKNQWLIRTPSKSFFVAAPSLEEKRAWMKHIEECRSNLLKAGACQTEPHFASSWIPDHAAFRCMRCLHKFTATKRRHHCRKCGFLVCNSCSKQRVVIANIHPTKRQRVCKLCHDRIKEEAEEKTARLRGDSTENKSGEEEEDLAASSDEEEVEEEEEEVQIHAPSRWLDSERGTWGQLGAYIYPKP